MKLGKSNAKGANLGLFWTFLKVGKKWAEEGVKRGLFLVFFNVCVWGSVPNTPLTHPLATSSQHPHNTHLFSPFSQHPLGTHTLDTPLTHPLAVSSQRTSF